MTELFGAVAVDSVGPSAAGIAVAGGSSLTWSHTVTATGQNLALVVGVAVGTLSDDSVLSLSVTYNGTPMPSVAKVHDNNQNVGFIQMFCLTAPATGAKTVSVTLSGGTADIIGGSVSFTGVNQTTPCRNAVTFAPSGTGQNSSISATVTSVVGDMVIDMVGTGGNISTSTQTLRWMKNVSNGTGGSNGAQSTVQGAPSVTVGYSGSADYWSIIGMDIASAGVSGALNACDVDASGILTTADVSGMVNMVLNLTPCTANIVGNGVCNVVAVQRVVNAANGGACVLGNSHTVVLGWTASTSSGVVGYNVYRSTTLNGALAKLNTGPVTVLTFSDATIQAGATYYYQVTSTDVSGNESVPSSPVQAVIPYP